MRLIILIGQVRVRINGVVLSLHLHFISLVVVDANSTLAKTESKTVNRIMPFDHSSH